MIQRTRMFKAIASLVLSMMFGAFVLASMEPDSNSRNSRTILLQAERTPDSIPSPTPANDWDSIDVAYAAAKTSVPSHIAIDSFARLRIQDAMREHQLLDGHGHAIVIAVEIPPGKSTLSILQRQTLGDVIQRLCDELSIPVHNVRYPSELRQ